MYTLNVTRLRPAAGSYADRIAGNSPQKPARPGRPRDAIAQKPRIQPSLGASVWASGSHVWNGNIGTLMAKPMKRPAKISDAVAVGSDAAAMVWRRAIMSNVWPPLKYRARKLRIISAEPNRVNRKNLIAAYCRLGPPQTPIMKYIGSSTSSKKTKNRMRSREAKVPFIPVASTRMRMRKALGLYGSGTWSHE